MKVATVEQTVVDEQTYMLPYLADWLRIAGVTHADAARHVQINQPWLHKIGKGKLKMRGHKVRALAELLGLPAPVFVFCSPFFDERGKTWAQEISLNRLTPAG